MPKPCLIIIIALAIITIILGTLYGITSVRLTNITNEYEALQIKYNNILNLYNNLQNQYNSVLLGQFIQLMPFIESIDNSSDSVELGYGYSIHEFLIIPYGYNALVTLNISCTKPTSISIETIPNTQALALPQILPQTCNASQVTLRLVLPPGNYYLALKSLGYGDIINYSANTVLLSDVTNVVDIVKGENTYKYTGTLPSGYIYIPIIVPYGYKLSIWINVTSNEHVNIMLTQVPYNETLAYLQTPYLAKNVTTYQRTIILTQGLYELKIQTTPNATINIDISPQQ